MSIIPEKMAPFVPSPLDAWRGSGRIAKQMGLPVFATPAIKPSPFLMEAPPPRGRELKRQVAAPKSSKSMSPCPCGCDRIDQIATIKTVVITAGEGGNLIVSGK